MNKTQMNAIHNILSNNGHMPLLQGVWVGKDRRNYCLCGYYGVAMNDPIPELDSVKGIESAEYVFEIPDGYEELATPKIKELREHVKGKRRDMSHVYKSREICWHFGFEKPSVNPWYLLDILRILPNAKIYYNPDKRSLSPIYFSHETGSGILLPVRIPNK